MNRRETMQRLAMPGSAKANEGERSERDAMASNLMLLRVEDKANNDEESEEEEKGTIVKVKTLKIVVAEWPSVHMNAS